MRAALYARVSTPEQKTIPLQIEAMRQYASARGWTITHEVEDVGSGASERRARDDIIRAARRRRIDVVLVWKLDRWGRSLVDLVTTLRELHELGVGFVSLTEALDFATPTGRALAGLLAVFAEFERDLLAERIKAGIALARSKGGRHGHPRTTAIYWDKVPALKEQGMSELEIARACGISKSSVIRILRRASAAKV